MLHSMPPERSQIPPFFVFRKGFRGRDIVFLGLAAPGAPDVTPRDDLVAVWKTMGQQRFQKLVIAVTKNGFFVPGNYSKVGRS